jgi:hypothetical protein
MELWLLERETAVAEREGEQADAAARTRLAARLGNRGLAELGARAGTAPLRAPTPRTASAAPARGEHAAARDDDARLLAVAARFIAGLGERGADWPALLAAAEAASERAAERVADLVARAVVASPLAVRRRFLADLGRLERAGTRRLVVLLRARFASAGAAPPGPEPEPEP